MKGILLSFSQGKGKVNVNGEIREFQFKQSKKNDIKAEELEDNMLIEFEMNPTTGKYEVIAIHEKNLISGDECIMVAMSTGSQTVNAVPIDILGINKVILLTTDFVNKKGTTKQFKDFLKNKKIEVEEVKILLSEESNVEILSEKISEILERTKKAQCYVNLTGGTKFYAIAAALGIQKVGDKSNQSLYLDIQTENMYIDDKASPYSSSLTLENILNLSGFTYMKKEAKKWILNDINNITLKKYLNLANDYINNINTLKEFHVSETERNINKLKNLLNNIDRVSDGLKEVGINCGGNLEQYKNQIKEKYPENNLEMKDYIKRDKKIENIMKKFSINRNETTTVFCEEKNLDMGYLFEKIAIAKILDIISKNNKLKNSIKEIYTSVKTVKNTENPELNPVEAEYDIVIVTKKATLIILEVKSGNYSGDTAKSKEYGAISKGGIYGKSAIIGPLVKNIDYIEKYIPQNIIDHEKVCKNTGITYIKFDKIEEELEKMI